MEQYKFFPFIKLETLSIGQLVACKSVTGAYDLGHEMNYDVYPVTELLNGMGKVGMCYYFPDEVIKVEAI